PPTSPVPVDAERRGAAVRIAAAPPATLPARRRSSGVLPRTAGQVPLLAGATTRSLPASPDRPPDSSALRPVGKVALRVPPDVFLRRSPALRARRRGARVHHGRARFRAVAVRADRFAPARAAEAAA